MAYLVKVSLRATNDLAEISVYIQADISDRANAWFTGLEAAIAGLAEMPRRCVQLPDRPGIRRLLYGTGRNTYRIFFRIDEKQRRVLVLRVRHGARHSSGV